jgi:aquaporin Z
VKRMQITTTMGDTHPGILKQEAGVASVAARAHWREYMMEAGELGFFMVSACFFTVLFEHPKSPLFIESPLVHRFLEGLAMGLTLLALIFSPWGQRSGAHMNPGFTLSFYLLGKIARWDAVFYTVAQFAGGIAGVLVSAVLMGNLVRHSPVNYVVTVPGPRGSQIAFAAEFVISFALMWVVLVTSNQKRLSRFTPFLAGILLTTYITIEAPFSGMSMNPARTFGSALSAHNWTALWVYFSAPPLAMVLAGQLYRFRCGAHRVFCAKLHHHNSKRCIFRCNYGAM